jgi:hypothetical protein
MVAAGLGQRRRNGLGACLSHDHENERYRKPRDSMAGALRKQGFHIVKYCHASHGNASQ